MVRPDSRSSTGPSFPVAFSIWRSRRACNTINISANWGRPKRVGAYSARQTHGSSRLGNDTVGQSRTPGATFRAPGLDILRAVRRRGRVFPGWLRCRCTLNAATYRPPCALHHHPHWKPRPVLARATSHRSRPPGEGLIRPGIA